MQTHLFSEFNDTKQNLLPCDGAAFYFGQVLDRADAAHYMQTLLAGTDWQYDVVQVFGKTHVTKRQTAWYGDRDYLYTYSGVGRRALPWTAELLELKTLVENACGHTFNSCLLNLYHSGAEGMGWHSDDEAELGPEPAIASLSLGAERRFAFRHKTLKTDVQILLGNGSLLLMQGKCQSHWHHSLPKALRVKTARINLTFRKITGS